MTTSKTEDNHFQSRRKSHSFSKESNKENTKEGELKPIMPPPTFGKVEMTKRKSLSTPNKKRRATIGPGGNKSAGFSKLILPSKTSKPSSEENEEKQESKKEEMIENEQRKDEKKTVETCSNDVKENEEEVKEPQEMNGGESEVKMNEENDVKLAREIEEKGGEDTTSEVNIIPTSSLVFGYPDTSNIDKFNSSDFGKKEEPAPMTRRISFGAPDYVDPDSEVNAKKSEESIVDIKPLEKVDTIDSVVDTSAKVENELASLPFDYKKTWIGVHTTENKYTLFFLYFKEVKGLEFEGIMKWPTKNKGTKTKFRGYFTSDSILISEEEIISGSSELISFIGEYQPTWNQIIGTCSTGGVVNGQFTLQSKE